MDRHSTSLTALSLSKGKTGGPRYLLRGVYPEFPPAGWRAHSAENFGLYAESTTYVKFLESGEADSSASAALSISGRAQRDSRVAHGRSLAMCMVFYFAHVAKYAMLRHPRPFSADAMHLWRTLVDENSLAGPKCFVFSGSSGYFHSRDADRLQRILRPITAFKGLPALQGSLKLLAD